MIPAGAVAILLGVALMAVSGMRIEFANLVAKLSLGAVNQQSARRTVAIMAAIVALFGILEIVAAVQMK